MQGLISLIAQDIKYYKTQQTNDLTQSSAMSKALFFSSDMLLDVLE